MLILMAAYNQYFCIYVKLMFDISQRSEIFDIVTVWIYGLKLVTEVNLSYIKFAIVYRVVHEYQNKHVKPVVFKTKSINQIAF